MRRLMQLALHAISTWRQYSAASLRQCAVLQAIMQRATAAHIAAAQKQAQAAALAQTAEQAAADAAMLDEFLSSVHAYELASIAT